MIVSFVRVVPVCAVRTALLNVFRDEKEIEYDGQVSQAGECHSSMVLNAGSGDPQRSLRGFQGVISFHNFIQ